MNATCPVCHEMTNENISRHEGVSADFIDCQNCGKFKISLRAKFAAEQLDDLDRSKLSFGIWKSQTNQEILVVSTETLEGLPKSPLPTPIEQVDWLVEFLGTTQSSPSARVTLPHRSLRAKIGAIDCESEQFTIQCAESMGLLDGTYKSLPSVGIRLTLEGWIRYEKIRKGAVTSRTAFIAMPFRNDKLTQLVESTFKPAVEETGFKLKRVDDDAKAGSIDDKIRVDIRMARFLIADLTGGNNGAYWEAGYAEGLEKPVIYTCSKEYFEANGTHFDTNHHLTVDWDEKEPEAFAEKLKATIRATLPFDAKMPQED